jgi:hypothetical protein
MTGLKWDGLWRCEIHPAGTHPTIEEAPDCLDSTGAAEVLRQATFSFLEPLPDESKP